MATTLRRSASFLMVVALVVGMLAMSVLPASARSSKPAAEPSIVDVALQVNGQSGEFSILIAALQAADPAVMETLSSKGQYTVFAPTDAAFGALLDELGVTAGELLSNQALVTEVLLYHVATGRRYAEDVVASDQIRMLNGGRVAQEGGVLTDANGRMSNIIAVDVEASNGVIHVIDRVLLP